MLTSELSILAIYGILVCITLVLQATGSLLQLDMGYLLSSRDEDRTVTGMAARTERALSNSVTAMALFAPAILLLAVQDRFSATTLLAAQVFLIARVIYLPAYVFGIVGIRTVAWMAGFFATLALFFLAV